jgi:hypothetical protein
MPDETTAVPASTFLTGVQHQWHAVPTGGMAYAARTSDGTLTIAQACCGDLVRVAPKLSPYNRGSVPVAHDPCQTCAWTVAALTGQLEVEIGRLTPVGTVRTAMTRIMRDPDIAATAAARILDAARGPGCPDGPADPATIQLLAAVAAHAPVLLINEACGEGDCDHDGEPCTFQGGTVACAACSLISGEWAGEWQGGFRPECRIEAPCQVLDELVQAAAGMHAVARDGVVARAQEIARGET